MRRHILYVSLGALSVVFFILLIAGGHVNGFIGSFSQIESGFEEIDESLSLDPLPFLDPYVNWKRPDGPVRVGIQAGHWYASEAPDEQEGLRDNTGAQASGFTEWEANLRIAEETKKLLEAKGIIADLLPTTIPPGYLADAFISIHADGSTDTTINGYKIASPRRDRSGKAQQLSDLIQARYGSSTLLSVSDTVTRNMRGYYAFSSRRYEHSIHPMTPGAILETGFISSVKDRKIIISNPKRAAQGIADGIIAFLQVTTPDLISK
ncbi:N-acetylmuramoyl-L-alanine amidase [Patescibacteria group bacterium]|nr:N-acetylmuramoyl-L-alanine amidase [Patescibacteria group bacterium]MBP9710511.1 N-acetylmuramoyl-L-alanine amidase [Patescibacteria group bacterium]